MKTREQAEARAWELYPEKDGWMKAKRKGFMKCWEEMQEKVEPKREEK